MSQELITRVGLIFDIIGAILLFVYGYPQPSFDEGMGLALAEDDQVKEHNAKVRAEKKIFDFRSRLGIGLIIIGFFIQIIATWIQV